MAMNTPSTAFVVRTGDGVAESHARHALGLCAAENLGDLAVIKDIDLGIGGQAHLVGLVGPQTVAAMDQRHIVGEIGEEQSFLGRRVAAADHRDIFPAIEKSVTGGAGRNPKALKGRLPTAGPASWRWRRWR